jgi:hypothetical protein
VSSSKKGPPLFIRADLEAPERLMQIDILVQQIAHLERTNRVLKVLAAILTFGLAMVAMNPIAANRAITSLAPLTRSELLSHMQQLPP